MRLLQKHDVPLLAVALILAVLTYLYVNDSLRRGNRQGQDPSYKLIKLTAKSLPIKVRFTSKPPEGYRLIQEMVTVNPSRLIVIGPEALLEGAPSAETAIMDISQSTKKIVKSIPVESVAGIHLSGEPYLVEVVVPIEQLQSNR